MLIKSKGLNLMFDIINKKHFNNLLPEIPLYFNDKSKLNGGLFEHTNGGIPIKIEVNKKMFDLYGKKEVYNVLKHEMIHYYLCITNKPCGHTTQFKYISDKIKAPLTCLSTRDDPKWKYNCSNPDCNQTYNTYRRYKNLNRRRCHICNSKLSETQLR